MAHAGRLVAECPDTEAPHVFREKIISRCKGDNLEATLGCFYSHFKLWQQLGDRHAVVVESDAVRHWDMIDALTWCSTDSITLLGGAIRAPRITKEEGFEEECAEIVAGLDYGPNPIDYERFSWTMTLAYYIPAGFARKLVELAESAPWRAVDRWLNRARIDGAPVVGELFFP